MLKNEIYIRACEGVEFRAPIPIIWLEDKICEILKSDFFDFDDHSFCTEFIPGDIVECKLLKNNDPLDILTAYKLIKPASLSNLENEFKWKVVMQNMKYEPEQVSKYRDAIDKIYNTIVNMNLRYQYPIHDWMEAYISSIK